MTATYEKIATTTLGTATATVTFSTITGSYTDLITVFNGAATGGFESITVKINNDTGTNYSRTLLIGTGSVATSSRASSESSLIIGVMGTENSNTIWQFMNYSNATTYKTILARANSASNTVRANVGLWRDTSAITQLDFTAGTTTFISGSTFTLYGIKAE